MGTVATDVLKITRYALDQMVKDYHWMMNVLESRFSGSDVEEEILREQYYKGASTAQYGIEATMPKASGGTSDPVGNEAIRKIQYGAKSMRKYAEHIRVVQDLSEKVVGERKLYVLHGILDGVTFRQLARDLKVADKTVRNIYETILDDMLSE